MRLKRFQKIVGRWEEKTFPTATQETRITHLFREVKELQESNSPEEAADCFILLLGHAHLGGYDLLKQAVKKMKINKGRTWGQPDAEGVQEHI